MKQIVGNMYLRSFKFLSPKENTTFLSSQDVKEILVLNDYSGDNYYCYICYNSLSQDKKFIVSFSTDEVEDNLNFLFWRNHKLIVFDTGSHIYIVDEKLNIVSSFEVTTPLIGFHLIDDENILFLEEAYLRVVNYKGEIVKKVLFDLIVDFTIKKDILTLQTDSGNKDIRLL